MVRRRGLTLVEMILAVFLLSEVMMMLFNLYPSSLASVARSDQTVQADLIAQSLLDNAQANPFASLTAGYSQDLPAQTLNGTSYSPHMDVLTVASRDPSLLLSLRVTVSWSVHAILHQTVCETWVVNVTH